jgi:hypothetical protein
MRIWSVLWNRLDNEFGTIECLTLNINVASCLFLLVSKLLRFISSRKSSWVRISYPLLVIMRATLFCKRCSLSTSVEPSLPHTFNYSSGNSRISARLGFQSLGLLALALSSGWRNGLQHWLITNPINSFMQFTADKLK